MKTLMPHLPAAGRAHALAEPLLEARGLGLVLGGRRVVDGVSVQLLAGEWVALVGPNGAGKSSLLQMLAGLRSPAAGEVLGAGQPLARLAAPARARHVAWLEQQGAAEGDLTSLDVVRLGRLPHHGWLGAPGPADEAAVQRAMQAMDCAAFATRRLATLSGGERQRVLLARALAVEPRVLLLDEPASHLDAPQLRALLVALARQAERGAAAAVMHDLTAALAADRLWVMAAGRLVADGPPADASVRQALVDVFAGAVQIEALTTASGPRWVALPVR